MDQDDWAKVWVAGVFDRAAPTYDEVAGAYHDHFGAALVDAVGVGADDVVLDVGCGRGAVLVPAAARVGTGGSVVGVDLSPEMVRLARERATRCRGHGANRCDGRRAPRPARRSFTVVLCGFGIFFLPDPERAVAGFRRVLVPGGRLGMSTWGTEDDRWAWEDELFADLVVERRAVRQPFDQASDLEVLLRNGGFDDITVARSPPRGLTRRSRGVVGVEVVVQLARRAGADRPSTARAVATRRVRADRGDARRRSRRTAVATRSAVRGGSGPGVAGPLPRRDVCVVVAGREEHTCFRRLAKFGEPCLDHFGRHQFCTDDQWPVRLRRVEEEP